LSTHWNSPATVTLTTLRKLHLAGRRRPCLLLPSSRLPFPGLDLAPETETAEGSANASLTDSATCLARAAAFSSWLLHRCAKENNFLSLRLLNNS
jgi:hypothetical protein